MRLQSSLSNLNRDQTNQFAFQYISTSGGITSPIYKYLTRSCIAIIRSLRTRQRLVCDLPTLVRKKKSLDIWPAFPVPVYISRTNSGDYKNALTALEHRDPVSVIDLVFDTTREVESAAVMQELFLVPTSLFLHSRAEEQFIPEASLGGPRRLYGRWS